MTHAAHHHKPVKITDKTDAHFKSVIDATSATLSGNTGTQWTGNAAMATFRDVTRTMQSLAVEAHNTPCIPAGSVLHALSQIPQQLHMVSCRLIAECLPAMLNAADDKAQAETTITEIVKSFNTQLHPVLMKLHQIMQSEDAQMREVGRWTGQTGLLFDAARVVKTQFLWLCVASRDIAPQSNPQGCMLWQEVQMQFDALEGTLQRCAS